MDLRERLADMLRQYFNWSPEACFDARASALTLADAILQIPEIKEALEYTERMSKHLAGMVAEDVAKLPIEPYSPKRISPS